MHRQTTSRRRFSRLATVLLTVALSGTVLGRPDASPFPTPDLTRELASSYPRHVWMEVTAYCPCKVCCGRRARGVTASGKTVRHNNGRFVAADTDVLPFNTLVSIPGYHDGQPVPVIDTGSAIVGHRLDVFFPSHQTAEKWGRKMLRVSVTRSR